MGGGGVFFIYFLGLFGLKITRPEREANSYGRVLYGNPNTDRNSSKRRSKQGETSDDSSTRLDLSDCLRSVHLHLKFYINRT